MTLTPKVLAAILILIAAVLRLYGIQNRPNGMDERNYRGHLHLAVGSIGKDSFRKHSVRHQEGAAPHGLVGIALSGVVGKLAHELFGPLLPDHSYKRDNFLCRLGGALSSLMTVGILFVMGWLIFGPWPAVGILCLAGLSPLQVNWGRAEYLDVHMVTFLLLSYLFLWLTIVSQSQRRFVFFAALSGCFVALAVGCKWSALPSLLMVPFTFVAVHFVKGINLDKRLFSYLSTYLFSMVVMVMLVQSPESFDWVLAPDPNDTFGDPEFEHGLFNLFLTSFTGIFEPVTWTSLIFLWGGIGLPFLIYLGFRLIAIDVKNGKALERKTLFVLGLTLHAILQTSVTMSFVNHRALFAAAAAVLFAGIGFEALAKASVKKIVLLSLILVLPHSVYHGLRLGDPLIPYLGMKDQYFSPLPEKPYFQQFFKKPRHEKFGGIFRNW